MPWKARRNPGACSESEPWEVVRSDTEAHVSCHATEQDALDHVAALYASEPQAASVRVGGPSSAVPTPPAVVSAQADAAGACSCNGGTARVAALTAPHSERYPTERCEYPELEWLLPSDFARSPRLAIADDGRAGGRFYERGTCIIDGSGSCWEPPPSPSHYQLFHQGDIVTADGVEHTLFVGAIGNVGGHASEFITNSAASQHYANPSRQLLVGRAYDDEDGAFFAGCLVPGVTYGDVALLRRSGLSGDWRMFRHGDNVGRVAAAAGGYDCLGPTLVTRPGLPIIRQFRRAASAAPVYQGGMAGVQRPNDQGARMAGVRLRNADGSEFVVDGATVVQADVEQARTAAGEPPDAEESESGPTPDAAWAQAVEDRLSAIEDALGELLANSRAAVAAEVRELADAPPIPV